MIRVRVTPPPFFDRSRLDERGWIELPEGSTLGDVMKLLKMPRPLSGFMRASINGAISAPDTELRDRDTIGFVSLFFGG